jgi:hypothetical protein
LYHAHAVFLGSDLASPAGIFHDNKKQSIIMQKITTDWIKRFQIWKKLLVTAGLAGMLATGSSVSAGTATYDFSTDPTFAGDFMVGGNGANQYPWQPSGGNPGGFLGLTYPLNDLFTSMVFPDIDGGALVTAFKFEADLRIGNSTGARAADGFSISFARANDPVLANLPNSLSSQGNFGGAAEFGTTTGIAISFDTWAGNTLPDGVRDFPVGAENDPGGIIVRVDNTTILRQPLPLYHGACEDPNSLQTGPRDPDYWAAGGNPFWEESWATLCWQRLSVELDPMGKLTVIWKGETILDQYQTDYFPSPGRLVLAGRTGGANQHAHFDNITLTTTTAQAGDPPPPPQNFQAAFAGARRVQLEWASSEERVSYEVERNGNVISTGVLLANTFLDQNVRPGTAYTYTLRALDINQTPSEPVSITVNTPAEAAGPGYLVAEIWDGLPGAAMSDLEALFANPAFPNSPDRTRYVNGISFGEPAFGNTYGDNLAVRIAGTLTVPETGAYHFFVRSDDASQFYLNTAGSALPVPGTDVPIAFEADCCDPFQEPDTFDEATTFSPIQLTAGQQYGFVFVVKEGGGGDWGQVAMRRVGDPTPAAQLQPVRGALVTGRGDPTGGSITITQQPQSQSVPANQSVTLEVAADVVSPYGLPPFHQWYRNGTLIPGATGTSYTTPFLTAADNNARFTAVIGTVGRTVTTEEATLTVGQDTTPPTVTGLSGSVSAAFVEFSEPINAATGGNVANYQISGGATITSATVLSGANEAGRVRLALSGVTGGGNYSVTITGVQDLAGNVVAETTLSFDAYHIFTNFNDGQVPEGVTLVGSANVQDAGGLNGSGFLELTPNAIGMQGSANYDDVLQGGLVNQFTATFKLFIGNGSGNPADGFSFSIAEDIDSMSNFGEEGGGTGLTVSFDTYDNGGGEAPAIDAKWFGELIPGTVVPKSVLVNNRWVDVLIQIDANGLLTVIHDNVIYYDKLDIGWFPLGAPRLNFGARTGGEFASHWIDDVAVIYNVEVELSVPVFETLPAGASIFAGGNVQLTASATGPGTISYQWQREVNGEWVNVSDGGNVSGATTGTLMINNATAAQTGNYRVVASSTGGAATSAAVRVAVVSTLQDVTAPGDPITSFGGNSPANEPVENAINNTTSKYLNFGEKPGGGTAAPFMGPVGLVVTPSAGASVVTGLRIYTANDAVARDPIDFILEGSNDGETFTEIASGPLALPDGRNPGGQPLDPLTQFHQEVLFENSTAYTSYRVTFTNVKDNAAANSMQIAEIELLGEGGVAGPALSISADRAAGTVTISWTGGGTLQSTTALEGEATIWTNVAGTSPVTVNMAENAQFFRVVE